MKKRLLFSLLTFFSIMGGVNLSAETWTYTFKAKDLASDATPTSPMSKVFNEVEWSYGFEWYNQSYIGTSAPIQIGSAAKVVKRAYFETAHFSNNNIKSITVKAGYTGSASLKLDVYTKNASGDVLFQSETQQITAKTTPAEYTVVLNSTAASVCIEIANSNTATSKNGAILLAALTVEYEPANDPDALEVTAPELSDNTETLAVNDGQVIITPTYTDNGAETYYTINGDNPTQGNGILYTAPLTFSNSGAYTVKAATKATNNGKDYWSDVVARAYKVTNPEMIIEEDVLDVDAFGLTENTYVYKTYDNADMGVTYGIVANKSGNGIGFNFGNKNLGKYSGLAVTKKSGLVRFVRSLSVTNLAAGSTLLVYGSNEPNDYAFAKADDFYTSDVTPAGIKLGELSADEPALNVTGNYRFFYIKPGGAKGGSYESITVGWETPRPVDAKFLNDVFNIEERIVRPNIAGHPVNFQGYFVPFYFDGDELYVQGLRGHTIVLTGMAGLKNDDELVMKETVLKNIPFVPSVKDGVFYGDVSNIDWADHEKHAHYVVADKNEIVLGPDESYKVTTVDITEESDWTKYAVGKTVYIKGKFDDVEVPEGTTDFDQYLDKMTFQNGAVKFSYLNEADESATAQAMNAVRRHVELTLYPHLATANDEYFEFRGILKPLAQIEAERSRGVAPTMEFLAVRTNGAVGDDITTGVEQVEVNRNDAPVEYFNLQGVRVDNPESGLYIRRQGSNIEKTIVK